MAAAGTDSAPWTIARLLDWTRAHFARHRLESPRLCAELLLAHALGCERIRLYTRHDEVPRPAVLDAFRELVRQAAEGRPIAYLTGTKEFFALPLEVTPDVLIPRPETEILVERTIDLVRKAPGPRRILDLGTGSGCIAIALARHLPDATLLASDVSPAALAVARRNAERHGVADRIEFRAGDLFGPWRVSAAAPCDIVVCNPPYVATVGAPVAPQVRAYEPHAALFAGPDGLDVIRRVLAEAPACLTPGGHLLLEMGFDQAAAVQRLAAGPVWGEAAVYRDGAGHARVLHVRVVAADAARVA